VVSELHVGSNIMIRFAPKSVRPHPLNLRKVRAQEINKFEIKKKVFHLAAP